MSKREQVRRYQLLGRLGIGALLLSCPLSCLLLSGRQAQTVPGPESPNLRGKLKGHLILAEPVGGISSITLSSGVKSTLRPPDFRDIADIPNAHSVSGPDTAGRFAFVDNRMVLKQHELHVMKLDGTGARTLFERPGDALWGDPVGDHLALSPRGEQIALISDLTRVQMDSPPAYLGEGTLETWDIRKAAGTKHGITALDTALSWFPDGRKLAYVSLLPPGTLPPDPSGEDSVAGSFGGWLRQPITCILDLDTGKSRPLHRGWNPVVSSDGKTLLLCDFETHWHLVDVHTGKSRPVSAPGAWGPPLALRDSKLVLYPALPTAGSKIQWTRNNSPLVGKKLMLTIKVADLDTGEFQTLFDTYDARMAISAGH